NNHGTVELRLSPSSVLKIQKGYTTMAVSVERSQESRFRKGTSLGGLSTMDWNENAGDQYLYFLPLYISLKMLISCVPSRRRERELGIFFYLNRPPSPPTARRSTNLSSVAPWLLMARISMTKFELSFSLPQ
ncbi:protein kinase superfamily protein, partial [Striga asiatica]